MDSRWRFRLQQRLALTRREARTLALLLIMLVTGLLVRHVRYRMLPYDAAYYAPIDSALAAASRPEVHEIASGMPISADSAASERGSVRTAMEAGLQVDLNRATQAELEQLPRIGPRTAERIVAFRTARGGFRRVEDLMLVQGIGEKTLERLRPHVTVRDPP